MYMYSIASMLHLYGIIAPSWCIRGSSKPIEPTDNSAFTTDLPYVHRVHAF